MKHSSTEILNAWDKWNKEINPTRSTSKKSKVIGNRGETQVVKILKERFPKLYFKRTDGSGRKVGGANAKKMIRLDEEIKASLAGDILAPKQFKFVIESKKYEELDLWSLFRNNGEEGQINEWIDQAKGDAKFAGKDWMLIIAIHGKTIDVECKKCKTKTQSKAVGKKQGRIVFISSLYEQHIESITKGYFRYKNTVCLLLSDLLKLDDPFFIKKKAD